MKIFSRRLTRRAGVITILLAISLLLSMAEAICAAERQGKVIVAELSGTVGVQMEDFVNKIVKKAAAEEAGLIVFKLDTPGGLVSATRGITQAILSSKVPVVMWVPFGGHAASAGAFIMQAAHVAVMSSGANIGAAHPVNISGDDIAEKEMEKKVINDLTAQMRALTQLRGRNEKMAQKMIMESISLTAQEALEDGVIDIIADDLPSLLSSVEGRFVVTDGAKTPIYFSQYEVEEVEMTFQEQLVQFLSSPDIAYILLLGGMLAIFYEVLIPGGFILGVTGGIMLLLGSIGLKMLPFNWAGIALLGAGVIVMGIDMMVGGMGILSLLGVAVIIAGGMFLFQTPGAEMLNISTEVIAGMAIALGLFFTIFAMMVAKSMRAKVTTGKSGMLGLAVEVTADLNPNGTVKCHGEIWKATAESGTIPMGATGTVVGIKGITLIIREK